MSTSLGISAALRGLEEQTMAKMFLSMPKPLASYNPNLAGINAEFYSLYMTCAGTFYRYAWRVLLFTIELYRHLITYLLPMLFGFRYLLDYTFVS